jgi:hypothetical protein
MKNVKVETKGNNIVLTIDTTKNFGRSKSSGANIIVASSGGNQAVMVGDREFKLGVNMFREPEPGE